MRAASVAVMAVLLAACGSTEPNNEMLTQQDVQGLSALGKEVEVVGDAEISVNGRTQRISLEGAVSGRIATSGPIELGSLDDDRDTTVTEQDSTGAIVTVYLSSGELSLSRNGLPVMTVHTIWKVVGGLRIPTERMISVYDVEGKVMEETIVRLYNVRVNRVDARERPALAYVVIDPDEPYYRYPRFWPFLRCAGSIAGIAGSILMAPPACATTVGCFGAGLAIWFSFNRYFDYCFAPK